MTRKPLTADELIEQINLRDYIADEDECNDISAKCKAVLEAQIEKADDRMKQVEKALGFINALWAKYDCEEVAELYDKFVKIEEALFGLEREEETGGRYRDHFIHMFDCFVFGLRIITSVTSQASKEQAKELFKIEKENLKEAGVPFSSNYEYQKRLFYLWTLVSTFHDIAIPFQHLAKLGKGISAFVEELGWVFTDPRVSMLNFDASQLYHYFDLLGGIYGGRLKVIDKGRKYKRSETQQHYVMKLLGREFDRRNHGVLSGFFMWKTVEEIFLIGRSKKYRDTFGVEEFDKYTEYVLEQDVARAALAISLHGIAEDVKSNVYPKIFPVDFGTYPLTFLLILSDELQEYLRWEGTRPSGEMIIVAHPAVDASFDSTDASISLQVSFSIATKDNQAVIEWAKKKAKHVGSAVPIERFEQAVWYIGHSIKKALERKLKMGDNFKLRLNVFQDWVTDIPLYGEDRFS